MPRSKREYRVAQVLSAVMMIGLTLTYVFMGEPAKYFYLVGFIPLLVTFAFLFVLATNRLWDLEAPSSAP